MPALGNGMLIRVALPNKEGITITAGISHFPFLLCRVYIEGLFNADCTVALLLDTIKKRHQIARQGSASFYTSETF